MLSELELKRQAYAQAVATERDAAANVFVAKRDYNMALADFWRAKFVEAGVRFNFTVVRLTRDDWRSDPCVIQNIITDTNGNFRMFVRQVTPAYKITGKTFAVSQFTGFEVVQES